MKRPCSEDRDQVLLSLVRGDAPPKEEPSVDAAFLNTIHESIRYLVSYTAGGPNLMEMSAEGQRRYVLGYALPFVRAGVPLNAIREAAVSYTERKEPFFPKNPGILLEIARAIMADRAPGWSPPKAIEAPSIARVEWIARSNATRARMGLPLLPMDECAQEAT